MRRKPGAKATRVGAPKRREQKKLSAPSKKRTVLPKSKPKSKVAARKRRVLRKKRSPISSRPRTKGRKQKKLSERGARLLEKRLREYREEQRRKKTKVVSKTAALASDRRVQAFDKVLRNEGFLVEKKRARTKRAIDTVITVRGVPSDPIKGRERMAKLWQKLSQALLASKRGLRGLRLAVQVNPTEEIWQLYEFQRAPMMTALRLLGKDGREKSAIAELRLAVTNLFHRMDENRWDASEWRFVFREERRK